MDSEAFNKFQKECYEIARDHGFHDDDAGLAEIALLRLQFTSRLARVHSEISEAHDWVQRGKPVTSVWWEGSKPEGVSIELADAIIRIADMAETYGIDLASALEMKMAYNRTREYRHGKAM